MRYAEVSVNSPIAQRRTFSYAIPPGMGIDVGQAVWVPFGDKLLQGIVLELSPYPAVEETKEIAGVIEPRPLLSPAQVQLVRWISQYYLSPLFDAVALMLPPGFERKTLTFISTPPTPPQADTSALTKEQKQILDLVQKRGKVSLKQIEKALGTRQARLAIAQLVEQGLVVKSQELEKIKIRPKEAPYLRLEVPASEAQQEAARLHRKGANKQAALLEFLAQQTGPVPWAEVRQNIKCDKVAADALVRKGVVTFQQVKVTREPISYHGITPSHPLTLTLAQESALKAIKSSLAKGNAPGFSPSRGYRQRQDRGLPSSPG